MADKHPEYWKVKAASLALAKAKLEAEMSIQHAQAQLMRVMSAAGLNPAMTYILDDDTETIRTQALTDASSPSPTD